MVFPNTIYFHVRIYPGSNRALASNEAATRINSNPLVYFLYLLVTC